MVVLRKENRDDLKKQKVEIDLKERGRLKKKDIKSNNKCRTIIWQK